MLRSVTKRKYEQNLRAESAERTRGRILEALRERIRRDPSGGISLEAVAEEAGVARSTVYAVFGSRAGLFDALARDVVGRPEYDRLLEVSRGPDPTAALREGIRATVDLYVSDYEVDRALYPLARLGDEAVAQAIGRREQERTGGMAGIARRLAARGHLRKGVGATRAAHLLWVLTAFDTFDLLWSGRGLDAGAISDLLFETAQRTLLTD
jgi:AcrR family transcriptional regulator